MIVDTSVMGEKVPGTETKEKSDQAVELEQALVLHDAMVKICLGLNDQSQVDHFVLSFLEPFLTGRIIPWPQIEDLGSLEWHLQRIADDGGFGAQEELSALTNDLAIWIVEHYYRPASPAQVSRLRPDFQRAGLGFLLYGCFESEREWLDEEEHTWFQRLFEYWIDSVWDGKIQVPLPRNILTVRQLIAWLANRDAARIPGCIVHVIEELAKKQISNEITSTI